MSDLSSAGNDDQAAAVPVAFAGTLPAELTPPAARDGPGQATVADHAADVEVFDREERGERLVLVPQRLLQRHAGLLGYLTENCGSHAVSAAFIF